MDAKLAAPCRHAGVPPLPVVERVSALIEALASDEEFLAKKGLTTSEYRSALPMALEAMRGSQSASNSDRRLFLISIFNAMVDRGIIERYEIPAYGEDTVYKLHVQDYGDIAVIQKGCPDGAHSSVRWTRPEWARETYLWWLCSSLAYEPGEHVAKGVNRLRQRFFGDAIDELDGVIFHNELCGTSQRPCPKAARGITISEKLVPPPCIYTMPQRAEAATEWNWSATQERSFPTKLLSLFGITPDEVPAYLGHVGFQRRGGSLRTTICSRYGAGRSTTFRN
jgi:hypothetical protein